MGIGRTLTAAVVAVAALAACGSDPTEVEKADEPTIEGVVIEDGQTNAHVANPTYDADPPSGGDHHQVWLTCGVYDAPVPNAHAVHSLEHGAVWFAYRPDLGDDQVALLREIADAHPDRVIVSPYPGVDSAVVAVAWERRLEVDDAADPRLGEFFDAYVNGAQAPEPAVTCENGIGDPAR